MGEVEPGILRRIDEFLDEDIGYGDITTEALVDAHAIVRAEVMCKDEGVLSGVDVAAAIFRRVGCVVKTSLRDGQKLTRGVKVMGVSGSARSVLKVERVALNVLSRMSGVATETNKILREARKGNRDIIVAATRKTIPGMRLFDKWAVFSAGGDTHRLRLDDSVLIKDNHLKLVRSITDAVKKAKEKASFTKKVEVEVTELEQVEEAARAGADIIMLDNFSVADARKAVQLLKKTGIRNNVILECSGSINSSNARSYASTGVDVISSGRITHSAISIDMSLEIIEVKKQ